MAKCEGDNVMDDFPDDAVKTRVALLRKEFNKNRKIVLQNVPGITVEVINSTQCLFSRRSCTTYA